MISGSFSKKGVFAMKSKKLFVEHIERKLAAWKSEIETFQSNADKIDQHASGRYSSAIMELIGRIQKTEKKLIAIEQLPEDAWHDLKHGAERAMADIEERLKRTKKRFDF